MKKILLALTMMFSLQPLAMVAAAPVDPNPVKQGAYALSGLGCGVASVANLIRIGFFTKQKKQLRWKDLCTTVGNASVNAVLGWLSIYLVKKSFN